MGRGTRRSAAFGCSGESADLRRVATYPARAMTATARGDPADLAGNRRRNECPIQRRILGPRGYSAASLCLKSFGLDSTPCIDFRSYRSRLASRADIALAIRQLSNSIQFVRFRSARRLTQIPSIGAMSDYNLTHLKQLEAESIHIIREVVAEFQNPVMLYTVGKDSAVMVHLARKAFYPAKPPFPLMHVDTTWKFREMIEFRENYARKELGWT